MLLEGIGDAVREDSDGEAEGELERGWHSLVGDPQDGAGFRDVDDNDVFYSDYCGGRLLTNSYSEALA